MTLCARQGTRSSPSGRPTGRAVDRTVAIPIRWFVPLLLISVAAAFSTAALVKMGWTLTHVSISR